MPQLTALEHGDVLEGKQYGTEWRVSGVITDTDTGDRVGVTVTEAREGSVRQNTFDQEDLKQFKRKAQ